MSGGARILTRVVGAIESLDGLGGNRLRPRDKETITVEVVHRVMDHYGTAPAVLEDTIFDTIYHERRRLETEPNRQLAAAQATTYDRIYRAAQGAGTARLQDLFREIVRAFAAEVAGHFNPQVYAVATRAVPPALNVLLNTLSPMRLLRAFRSGFGSLADQLEILGHHEQLVSLAARATTVLVPTHSSNLDSILVGYALHQMGLPPYVYGAGLNLFSNRLVGLFMHNLGAYKVDRRKKALVYKDVLKTYAGLSMEMGYHNLFFPGGTRSRSGAVEEKLKLGLLGMGLDAYVHNLRAGRSAPDVFVVPCTINYGLVLEAETLIEDHLKEMGKSRYIIEDDEFSQVRRVLDFVQKLFSLSSRIQLVFGQPLDVFGNEVDGEGRSHDRRGRPIDRARYVWQDGAPALDAQRDEQYTRELAGAIVTAYRRDTVVNAVQLISHVVFWMLREANPGLDLYRLLRTGGGSDSLALTQVYQRTERELGQLRARAAAGQIRLDRLLTQNDMVAIVGDALAHLGGYHRKPAVIRRGDRLFAGDRNLLYYYQNRVRAACLSTAEVD